MLQSVGSFFGWGGGLELPTLSNHDTIQMIHSVHQVIHSVVLSACLTYTLQYLPVLND